jgi:hypothetical protein
MEHTAQTEEASHVTSQTEIPRGSDIDSIYLWTEAVMTAHEQATERTVSQMVGQYNAWLFGENMEDANEHMG